MVILQFFFSKPLFLNSLDWSLNRRVHIALEGQRILFVDACMMLYILYFPVYRSKEDYNNFTSAHSWRLITLAVWSFHWINSPSRSILCFSLLTGRVCYRTEHVLAGHIFDIWTMSTFFSVLSREKKRKRKIRNLKCVLLNCHYYY